MSATDHMRDMISQLMGTNATTTGGVSSEEQRRRRKYAYSDPRVCKAFLFGCCPHDILASTRMDMGECQRVHDTALKADYTKAQQEKDHFYDIEALEQLEKFFADCDRKMAFAKQRLSETQEQLSDENQTKAEKVLVLNEEIGKALATAEQLGADGQVDESLKMMEQVEELKKRKSEADQDLRSSIPASTYQQQKLRVCEVCSAYLGIHDNDRRLADHFGGKLHMGFVFLREQLAELRTTAAERRALSEKAGHTSYGSSGDYYDRERRRSRDRSRDKERDRGRRSEGEVRRRRSRSGNRDTHSRGDSKSSRSAREGSSGSHHRRHDQDNGDRGTKRRRRSGDSDDEDGSNKGKKDGRRYSPAADDDYSRRVRRKDRDGGKDRGSLSDIDD